MTAQQPEQYIIDGEYIEKLDEWLGEHGIDDLQRMQIRARIKLSPHTPAPERKERYTGVCAVQDNCKDYADFIESIEDELSEDDDPVCPIKCAKRVNPQQAGEQ